MQPKATSFARHLTTRTLALGFAFLTGCGQSPLLHHLNASDVRPTSETPSDCPIAFDKEGLCAAIAWTKVPTDSENGSFTLTFWKKGAAGDLTDPGDTVAVKLWMPAMGHGSSLVSVAPTLDSNGRAVTGSFNATGVYFIMPGAWEIWVQLKQGSQIIDQAKLDYNL
jgi:hypothetical protein